MKTEFTEPLWFGMDVDAELARLNEEDRRSGQVETTAREPSRTTRRRALRVALPTMGKGVATRLPLTA